MFRKEMMVFYVADEPDSGRMGTSSAYCVGFDGKKSYRDDMQEMPKTFEDMIEFLKNKNLVMSQSDSSMFFFDVIMRSAKGSGQNIKAITDFKFGDSAYLGMGNFGYSLGQLTVNVTVNNE